MEYKTKLRLTKTNHVQLPVIINGVIGNFIIDTGANNSCIDLEYIEYFKVSAEKSEIKAFGAGETPINFKKSKSNKIKIGNWISNEMNLMILDLSHINQAFKNSNESTIHGIIGSDILLIGKCIIDYNKLEIQFN